MRFRLLGPLEIQAGGRRVPVAADKQRTVAAALLAARGRAVPVAALVNEIWGEHVPASAVPNLRTYVMRLRRGDEELAARLTTAPTGYLLRVEPDELDVRVFEEATRQGREAMAEGDACTAVSAFDHALAQWRGGALEDVRLGPALNELAQALAEQFARTVEDHATAALALGDHREVVDRLRPFVERHPLRERAHARLMLALYRCGDVHGAIRVFQRAREVLREELGVDPGGELRGLLQSIVSRAPELDTPRPGPAAAVSRPVPRQLPPGPTVFVGRSAELGRTAAALRADTGPAVVAIHGPAGIGKSALALRAAHAVADHFPDGQLYADLQGARSGLRPLPSRAVLGRFLRALGVDRHRLPKSEAEAAALLQSLLAERRVLVLLDNAADPSQVRPLLPAGPGCATVVTSRSVLCTLDAEQVGLGELGHADVVRALALQAGEARVAREPEALGAVARACGGHALAVRIVGARLTERPDLPIARLGERLERRRLAEWCSGDLDLRACFAASYETLSDTAATALRLLAARRSADLDVGRVAVLLGSDAPTAEAALDELVRARLLDAVGERRFRMHRLVRLYATELPSGDPRTTRTAAFAYGV
ncbi:BTAD domain-containing putative transcriptional regulator [Streptomyces sp. NPDC002888]|uniref:AfsR/SARP family transcriptional regulator n=1 Tax=Streptomyces sp. NPDC002888 TaxID=3364668 RepID=UPI00369C0139